MNKKLHPIMIISLLVMFALSACGRPPAPPRDQPAQAQPSQNQNPQPEQPQTAAPVAPATQPTAETASPVSPSAATTNSLPQSFNLTQVAGSYQFTEGPAVDLGGNVYFSDIDAGTIYKWSPDGNISVFFAGLNRPNGLMFDKNGDLIVCEGGNGQLLSINQQGMITTLVDKYNGTRFNEPNDLWIDAQGGIYFSDPAYQASVVQDGQHVYYLAPDRVTVTRVISDMVKPNGLVGTADRKTLYVADHDANQTFAYDINSDGTLTNKRLFASVGSDGMDLDASGNLYLTTPNKVQIFDAAGNHLQDIAIAQENPTNVAFAGADHQTLFITARSLVFTAPMSAQSATGAASPSMASSTFTLTSPDLPADNRLPVEYTCDGASSTLALVWSGAPAGTQSYAVVMHHVAPDNTIHWYWVVYNLSANVTSLAKNVDLSSMGSLGNNSVNDRNEYAPPCSKGPGDKEYIYTVYALSAQPQITTSPVNREVLLNAIQDITLGSAELRVVYARP
jgi:gluconolactonase